MYTFFTHPGKTGNTKLLRKAITKGAIRRANELKHCCARKCFLKFKKIDIKKVRYQYWSKTSLRRKEWVFDKLQSSAKHKNKHYMTIDSGIRLCSKSFRELYKINKNTFYKMLNKFREGAVSGGLPRQRTCQDVTTKLIEWLESYFSSHGDRMPDTSTILLPYKTRKNTIYERYKEEMLETMERFASRSGFFDWWKKCYGHVKIKKVNA